MEENEKKTNKKQYIVAAIIALVAIIMLISVASEKKEKAVEPSPVVEKQQTQEVSKSSEDTEKKEEVKQEAKAQPEVKKDIIKIEPENAVLTFEATSDKAFDYQIFYTVEREVWFDATHVVDVAGKEGLHKYSVVIPSDKVYRVRIDFGSEPGMVTIRNIYMNGVQQADLNNFDKYSYNKIDKKNKNNDGSLTIISSQEDPFIEYKEALLPE